MTPHVISITGDPDSGKTYMCFALREMMKERLKRDVTVTMLGVEPPAYNMTGIPKAWREGTTVVKLGYSTPKPTEGKSVSELIAEKPYRLTDEKYYDAVTKAGKKTYGTDIIIVDTLTGMAKNRLNDELAKQKGVHSEYYRENKCGQVLAETFFNYLYDHNTGSTIIALHHAKKILEGTERKFKGYLPELVGTKLDDTWGGKFEAVLFQERLQKERTVRGQGSVIENEHIIHLDRGPRCKFVFMRHVAGTKIDQKMNVTIESPADIKPMTDAWVKIVDVLDEAT